MEPTIRAPRVFLGGPFSAALTRDRQGGYRFADETLRQQLQRLMKAIASTGAEVINSHVVDHWGEEPFPENFAARDCRWVEECDAYVALLPTNRNGEPYRTDGTFVEVGSAIGARKDAILLVDDPAMPGWSYFVQNLATSSLVKVSSPQALCDDPMTVLFGKLFAPERDDVRRCVTDVCLWNWFQRHASEPLPVRVGKAELVVQPGVMNPRFSHSPDFLMEFWQIPAGGSVLDVGCGSGVAGINALLAGAGKLLAIDVNPVAVENTNANLRLNNLQDRGRAVCSDVFSAVRGTYDVVLFNPPYWDGAAQAASIVMEKAVFDEPGHGFTRRVLGNVRRYIKPGGRCFIAYSDQGDLGMISRSIEAAGLKVENLHVQRPDRPGFHVRVGWEISSNQEKL